MVGRDVPGAPRTRNVLGDVIGDDIGNGSGTRAAEDVGPYQKTRTKRYQPNGVSMVGRNIPGAPRTRNVLEDDIGDDIGNGSGTRATEDVGPYQAIGPYHVNGPCVTSYKINV